MLVTRRKRINRKNPDQTDMIGRRRHITIGGFEVYIRYIYKDLLSRFEYSSRGNLFQLMEQLEQLPFQFLNIFLGDQMYAGKILDVIDQENEQFIIPYILCVRKLLRLPHKFSLFFQEFILDLHILEMLLYINLFKLIHPLEHSKFRQKFIF